MKKILITAFALSLAAPALAAQQDIAQLSAVTASREALRTAVNTQLLAVQSNFDEVYAVIDAGPVYVNASAPVDTKVVWIDTDQDNAIKVYVGGVWTVVGSGGEGSYTLPTAAADTLGGVKVGARLTITDGVLSADVQTGGESTTVGDGTTGPYLDGTVDGGTLIKLSAPSGGNGTWTSLQGGNPTANRNWRLPIDAPPAAGTTRLINVDENTQMGLVDPATFLTPTGSGSSLTGSFTGTLLSTQTTLSGAIQTIGTELDGQDELLFDSDDFTETAGTGTVTVSIDKSAVEATQPSTLVLTADTSITEANLLSSKYLSNYGASGEVDIILPAISYNQTRTILIEAAQVLEISPPSGEVLELSGTDLTADYCVNSGSVVGNKATVTRLRTGASTWKWSIDVVRGPWASCGAASD